jgi:hypothetical protein
MKARTARAWAVLAGLLAVVAASLDATAGAYAVAGAVLVAAALLIACLDGLRKRGRTPR